MNTPILDPAWFLRDAVTVAPDLLGCTLVRQFDDGTRMSGVITETEAYRMDDPASHSFLGCRPRCASMFLSGGHAYVYLIYGMYHCFNIVTGPEGTGEAVLIRAMHVPGAPRQPNGPGKLCQLLAIDRRLDGIDLRDPDGPIRLFHPTGPVRFSTTGRIGIRKNADAPWRFVLETGVFPE